MHFDLFSPPPDHPLRPLVHSIFHVRDATPASHTETILPKGNIDLLFNLGDPIEASGARNRSVLPSGRALLAGVQTSGFSTEPRGATNLVGVSLRMEHASTFLQIDQDEITDLHIDAGDVLPETAALLDQLVLAPGFGERRTLLLDWMAARVRISRRQRLIGHACRALAAAPGERRVAALAEDAGMSPRHFQRVFTAAVGVTPSRYGKMRRFVKALHLIPRLPTLTEVAHAASYTDHAHLCRDFREFAAMTPEAYRRHAGPVPGHVLIGPPAVSDSYKPR